MSGADSIRSNVSGCVAIIERELLVLLRAPRVLAVLAGVAAGFASVVVLKWPSDGIVALSGDQAQLTFQWLTYSLLAIALLVLPVFPSTGLVRELRGRTLELLLNSPLTRSAIYLGKVGAMLGFVVLLFAVTFPAVATCYRMGGLSLTGDIFRLYALLFVVSLQLIVVGLLVGTYCRSSEAALRWSYGATFLCLVTTAVPDYLLQGSPGVLAGTAAWLKRVSPIPAAMQLAGQDSVGRAGVMDDTNYLVWYVVLASVFVIVGSMVCIRRLNHGLLDRSRPQGLITNEQSRGVQLARRALFLVDPQRRSAGTPWFMNPVLVKEFRSRQFGRLHWLLRLVAGCAVLSLLLTLTTTTGTVQWGVSEVGGMIIVLQSALIILLSPGLSGAMFAGELESGSWNILRLTPMTAASILRGKLMSGCITLALLLCATLPGYVVIMMIQPNLRDQVVQVTVSLVLTAVLALLIGATVSSFVRTTATATTISYTILVALFVGPILIWMNRDQPFGFNTVEQALRLNPMAAALSSMRVADFEHYNLVPAAWRVTGVSCCSLVIVLYLRLCSLCSPD